MAAYSAIVSLMNTMELIQNHPHHSFSFDSKQIESLGEKLSFLQDFLERNSHGAGSEEDDVLESQIAVAAHEAEDVMESHVVDQIHSGSTLGGKTSSLFLIDLQTVIEHMESIKHMAKNVKLHQLSTYSEAAVSSRTPTTGKDAAVVGLDDDEFVFQLKDVLTSQQPSRRIISIVGMGGIGKTTIARSIFEDLLIVQHFDIRVWTTVSQEYSVSQILSELLSSQKRSNLGNVSELGENLYKKLCGRRYLIVLDDMWSSEVWDRIKFFFPDNGNSGRVIVTTRLSNVAMYCDSSCFGMKFLDEDKSWNLFCKNAFQEQVCPPELEKVGKRIVKKCRGLPLSIVVLGGHLRKSFKTEEYWETVANDINSVLGSGEDEQCLNILSLSYRHLPVHLKPCFLYMGIFPEDLEIRVSILIKLWVAEGFLKPSETHSLEEVARAYFADLVDRNLILVRARSWNGGIKTCGLHDLVRDLCLRLVEKEKLFCVLDDDAPSRGFDRERHVVNYGSKHHLPASFTDVQRGAAPALIRLQIAENTQFRSSNTKRR